MEKNSSFKREIYKIVKYQTKLSSSQNINKSEMYREKLNEHVQKMKMFGGSAENILNTVGGMNLTEIKNEKINLNQNQNQSQNIMKNSVFDNLEKDLEDYNNSIDSRINNINKLFS